MACNRCRENECLCPGSEIAERNRRERDARQLKRHTIDRALAAWQSRDPEIRAQFVKDLRERGDLGDRAADVLEALGSDAEDDVSDEEILHLGGLFAAACNERQAAFTDSAWDKVDEVSARCDELETKITAEIAALPKGRRARFVGLYVPLRRWAY